MPVFHRVSIVLEALDLSLKLLVLRLEQAGLEFGEGRDDLSGFIVADLLEQRRDPRVRLGRAAAIEFVFVGMEIT
jgi:hypothetical protein